MVFTLPTTNPTPQNTNHTTSIVMTGPSIPDCPDDTLFIIMSYLTLTGIDRLRAVCRQLKHFVDNNRKTFWTINGRCIESRIWYLPQQVSETMYRKLTSALARELKCLDTIGVVLLYHPKFPGSDRDRRRTHLISLKAQLLSRKKLTAVKKTHPGQLASLCSAELADVWSHIGSFLDVSSSGRLGRVSKFFHSIVFSHPWLQAQYSVLAIMQHMSQRCTYRAVTWDYAMKLDCFIWPEEHYRSNSELARQLYQGPAIAMFDLSRNQMRTTRTDGRDHPSETTRRLRRRRRSVFSKQVSGALFTSKYSNENAIDRPLVASSMRRTSVEVTINCVPVPWQPNLKESFVILEPFFYKL